MKVMGIDPGLVVTGYGIIEDGRVLKRGLIKPDGKEIGKRLKELFSEISKILYEENPDFAVLEEIVYHKNPKTFFLLGAARGVTLLALEEKNIPFFEIAPTKVKLAITGNGRARKEQVAFMVKKFLDIDEELSHHITDALACALAFIKRKNVICY